MHILFQIIIFLIVVISISSIAQAPFSIILNDQYIQDKTMVRNTTHIFRAFLTSNGPRVHVFDQYGRLVPEPTTIFHPLEQLEVKNGIILFSQDNLVWILVTGFGIRGGPKLNEGVKAITKKSNASGSSYEIFTYQKEYNHYQDNAKGTPVYSTHFNISMVELIQFVQDFLPPVLSRSLQLLGLNAQKMPDTLGPIRDAYEKLFSLYDNPDNFEKEFSEQFKKKPEAEDKINAKKFAEHLTNVYECMKWYYHATGDELLLPPLQWPKMSDEHYDNLRKSMTSWPKNILKTR